RHAQTKSNAAPKGNLRGLFRCMATLACGVAIWAEMRAFAELLDRLSLTSSRNAKLVLLHDYLRATPDPDRGWALAALTGDLTFNEAKPAMIRRAVEARVDPVLFGWSYDYVGDLAETVALIWPGTPDRRPNREPELSEVI